MNIFIVTLPAKVKNAADLKGDTRLPGEPSLGCIASWLVRRLVGLAARRSDVLPIGTTGLQNGKIQTRHNDADGENHADEGEHLVAGLLFSIQTGAPFLIRCRS